MVSGTGEIAPESGEVPAIEIRDVGKSYGGFTAIRSLNLSVRQGEFLSLLGPSGCGKSTMLRLIAGFVAPDRGRIFVNGEDVTGRSPDRRPLNMVFQRYALFPHMTVAGNIGYPLRLRKWPREKVAERVDELLAMVRLEGMEKRMPDEISGGQAQRVALARALAVSPPVLLLDEPLAALDRAVRGDLQKELARIHAETGTTFVYVTHDQEEAMSLSSRVALMDAGEIVQIGPPSALYERPETTFAAEFVGDVNILECDLRTEGGRAVAEWRGMTIPLADEPRAGARSARLVLRPEDLTLAVAGANGGAGLPVEVVSSSYHGFYWIHQVVPLGGGQPLLVREVAQRSVAAGGAPLQVEFPAVGVTAIDG